MVFQEYEHISPEKKQKTTHHSCPCFSSFSFAEEHQWNWIRTAKPEKPLFGSSIVLLKTQHAVFVKMTDSATEARRTPL